MGRSTKQERMARKCGYRATAIAIGTVAETDRTPEVKFTYRPLSYGERVKLEAQQVAIDINTPEGYEEFSRVSTSVVRTHLVGWDLKKPVDPQNGDGEWVTVDFRDQAELDCVDQYIIEKVADEIWKDPQSLTVDAVKNSSGARRSTGRARKRTEGTAKPADSSSSMTKRTSR